VGVAKRKRDFERAGGKSTGYIHLFKRHKQVFVRRTLEQRWGEPFTEGQPHQISTQKREKGGERRFNQGEKGTAHWKFINTKDAALHYHHRLSSDSFLRQVALKERKDVVRPTNPSEITEPRDSRFQLSMGQVSFTTLVLRGSKRTKTLAAKTKTSGQKMSLGLLLASGRKLRACRGEEESNLLVGVPIVARRPGSLEGLSLTEG